MKKLLGWFTVLLCCVAHAESRILWQCLHDYHTIEEPQDAGRQDRRRVNPFLSYTNIGTDFGFVGPAEKKIGWQSGQIGVTLGNRPDEWAGMWHSMSRLARMPEYVINCSAFYPAPIQAAFQPKMTGIRVRLRGTGKWKIELVCARNQVLWSETREIIQPTFQDEIFELPYAELQAVKMCNWIAEPGADIDVDRIDFRIVTPDVTPETWFFLASYAKALICWSPSTGLVRDRAHIDDANFDSVSATGLFCLATAAAADEGIVTKDFALSIVRKAHEVMRPLRGPYQLLPHFVRRNEAGVLARHQGTEFSTIDTSLFYLSLIIAAEMLGDDVLGQSLMRDVKEIPVRALIDDEGFLSHGVMADEKTIIPFVWKDWGGESALALILMKVSAPDLLGKMLPTARPHQGTGFIAEIQSLLFPQFDSMQPDAISGANWNEVRRKLLIDQKNYLPDHHPDHPFSALQFFGFSAGEQYHGKGYAVGGVDLPDQMLLHPHYILMSAPLADDPQAFIALMKRLEQQQVFTPLGMVENVALKDQSTLSMIGSLNACFEALGAYHFLIRCTKKDNVIYDAARAVPELNVALEKFYPTSPSSSPIK